MTELHEHSATDLRVMLRTDQVTPTELAEHYLTRIEELQDLGAFVTVTPELALQRAAELEAERFESDPGSELELAPLWGLPHADKDLTVRPGVPVYFGSAAVQAVAKAHPEVLAMLPTDPIVELADSVGLVSLGKTNTPEFGLYSYTESAVAPPAVHPLDHTLGAGGSSGGGAVAVATGQLPFAIGSDGGGSVRIPAATVGIVGLKPTLGAVPVDNTSPEAGGVVNGPLARSVMDAALLFEAMTRAPEGTVTARVKRHPRPLRIGFATDSPWNPTYTFEPDPMLVSALDQSLSLLGRLGHQIGDRVSLADSDYGAVFLRSWQLSASKIPPFLDTALFGPVTQWLVEKGRSFSPDEAAQNLADKQSFATRCTALLAEIDVLVTPALGMLPQRIGWYSADPETNFEQQCRYTPYTSFVNVLGWPAITIPVSSAVHGPAGVDVPIGIQLIGKPGDDLLLLQLAGQIEEALRVG